MDPTQENRPSGPAPGWRPQFGLLTLLLVTVIFSLAFAVLGGLLRQQGAADSATFVLLAAAGPLALIVLVGLIKLGMQVFGGSQEDDL
jgi:hypothetical protein